MLLKLFCRLPLSQQEVDHPHRNKISPLQSSGAIAELKNESLHLRHPAMELSHVSRVQREANSPSFVPSSAVAHKPEMALTHLKGPQVISGPPPPAASGPSQMRPDLKMEHTEHRSVDTVKLLTVSIHTQDVNPSVTLVIRDSYCSFSLTVSVLEQQATGRQIGGARIEEKVILCKCLAMRLKS